MKEKITTLHLYNCDEATSISHYQALIGKNDAVLVYCQNISSEKYHSIKQQLKGHKLYFLSAKKNTNRTHIDYNDWAQLYTQAEKTFSWK